MFERLGLGLRTFRELTGKSQAEVARAAGIGKSQLSKYENGKELPKLDSLGRILSTLETSPLTFFYGIAVLERGFDPGRSVEAELLRSGSIGPLLRAQEEAGLRGLFEQLLSVLEMAVESRVLDRIAHERGSS